MWQKGPGEGYMAAKDEVRELCPDAVCRVIYFPSGKRAGYVVEDAEGNTLGRAIGATLRD